MRRETVIKLQEKKRAGRRMKAEREREREMSQKGIIYFQ